MMDKKYEGTGFIIVGFIMGALLNVGNHAIYTCAKEI
jgi:hypothetical protein